MSVLFPLFLAGLGALGLPLLFHLVRRTPRGRQEFSSLMFLAPTPPRLTRRSRLDQILLLLLRLAALALLTLAFARPFLRESASLAVTDLPGRRVAILMDVSASMRRTGLWPQAVAVAAKELEGLNPQDDVALFAFDDRLRTVLGFEENGLVPGKPDLVRQRLKELAPTWGGTDLGLALATVAGDMDASGDVQQSALEPQIVLIGDLQKGSRLESLENLEWPQRVKVVVRQLKPAGSTNAHTHILFDESSGPAESVRVRVVNSLDARNEKFTVGWSPDGRKQDALAIVPVYVPAGQSRVLRLLRTVEQASADKIELRGDDDDFDNSFHVVPPARRKVSVMYIGDEADEDLRGLRHYLRLATANDVLREVEIIPLEPDRLRGTESRPAVELVVLGKADTPELHADLLRYVEQGGTLMFAPTDAAAAESLPALFDGVDSVEAADATEGGYLLLGEIDFSHPLFAPFAVPPYSDFTKIHFWRGWRFRMKSEGTAVQAESSPGTVVVARFDNGDPALLERRLGTGRVLALASSWRPIDSQFALSSKFVAFVGSLIDLAAGDVESSPTLAVGQPAALPAAFLNAAGVVRTPKGSEVELPAGSTLFSATDEPGIYEARVAGESSRFAVNLAGAESNTAPLEVEQLEQRGVRLGDAPTRSERIERVRQQRDTELESRQKLWRWLLVGVLALVIVETLWASRAEQLVEQSRAAP